MSSPVHPPPSDTNTAPTVAVAAPLDRDLSFTDRRAAVERGEYNNTQKKTKKKKKKAAPNEEEEVVYPTENGPEETGIVEPGVSEIVPVPVTLPAPGHCAAGEFCQAPSEANLSVPWAHHCGNCMGQIHTGLWCGVPFSDTSVTLGVVIHLQLLTLECQYNLGKDAPYQSKTIICHACLRKLEEPARSIVTNLRRVEQSGNCVTNRVRDTAAATAVINASPATATIDLVTLKPYLSEVMYDDLIYYSESELNASEYYNPDDDLCKPVILTVMGIGVEGFPDPDEIEHIVDVKRVIQRNKSTLFNNSEILPNKRTSLPYLKKEVVRRASSFPRA